MRNGLKSFQLTQPAEKNNENRMSMYAIWRTNNNNENEWALPTLFFSRVVKPSRRKFNNIEWTRTTYSDKLGEMHEI